MEQLENLQELERLKEFARFMLSNKTCGFISIDSIRYKAMELGILKARIAYEPCCEKCSCAERFSEYEFDHGVMCYER